MKNDDLNVSLLAQDSVVNENYIYVPSNLKISGTVHLNIECKGKLVISSQGVVEGNIKAKNLVIEGKLKGDAWILDNLNIARSATLTGYISAAKLKIDEGAVCHFVADIDRESKARYKKAELNSVPEHLLSKQEDIEKFVNKSPEKTSANSKKKNLKLTKSPDKSGKKSETDHFW